MFLTPLTIESFPVGTEVRVVRHGYRRHYPGRIAKITDVVVTVELLNVVRIDDDTIRLYEGNLMSFVISGDYAVVAIADTPWEAIPHPQSEEWECLLYEAEVELMGEVEPIPYEEIPYRLRYCIENGISREEFDIMCGERLLAALQQLRENR